MTVQLRRDRYPEIEWHRFAVPGKGVNANALIYYNRAARKFIIYSFDYGLQRVSKSKWPFGNLIDNYGREVILKIYIMSCVPFPYSIIIVRFKITWKHAIHKIVSDTEHKKKLFFLFPSTLLIRQKF